MFFVLLASTIPKKYKYFGLKYYFLIRVDFYSRTMCYLVKIHFKSKSHTLHNEYETSAVGILNVILAAT